MQEVIAHKKIDVKKQESNGSRTLSQPFSVLGISQPALSSSSSSVISSYPSSIVSRSHSNQLVERPVTVNYPKKVISGLSKKSNRVVLSLSSRGIGLLGKNPNIFSEDLDFGGVVQALVAVAPQIDSLALHYSFELACWNTLMGLGVLVARSIEGDVLQVDLLEGRLINGLFGAPFVGQKLDKNIVLMFYDALDALMEYGQTLAKLVLHARTRPDEVPEKEEDIDDELFDKAVVNILRKLTPYIAPLLAILFKKFNKKSLDLLVKSFKNKSKTTEKGLDDIEGMQFQWKQFQDQYVFSENAADLIPKIPLAKSLKQLKANNQTSDSAEKKYVCVPPEIYYD